MLREKTMTTSVLRWPGVSRTRESRSWPRALTLVCALWGVDGGLPALAQPALPDLSTQPFDISQVEPSSYRAVATRLPDGQAPRIDGRLDDEVWQLASAQGNFVQREPRYGSAASERTAFRVLYDEKTIYVGVWAFDSSPPGILASELKRDSRHLPRSSQLLLLQHQPAGRPEGCEHRLA